MRSSLVARLCAFILASTLALPCSTATAQRWGHGGGWHGGWGGWHGGWGWRGGWGGWGWRGGWGWGPGFGFVVPPVGYGYGWPYYYPPPVYYAPPPYYPQGYAYGYTVPYQYPYAPGAYSQPYRGPDPNNCGTPERPRPCTR
jgi:hypothetical protein